MDVSSAIETVRKNRAADLDRGRAVYERALSDPAFYAAEKAVRARRSTLPAARSKRPTSTKQRPNAKTRSTVWV